MNDRGTRADRQPAVWNENTGVVLARRTPTGASSHARWDRAAINSVWDSNARSFGCWLSRLRACRRYEVITGVLGSAWFMVLALVVAVRALQLAESIIAADFSAAGWPALVVSVCMLTFFLMLWWFTLPRSSPTARTDKLLPSLVAFVGSYLPWAIALVTPERISASQNLASAALLLIGNGLMVVVLCYLGHSFSVVPKARKTVRTGPYAVIRHPLYFVEEVAILGTLLQYLSPLSLALFLVHGAVQVRRILYEEELLRRTLPDYEDYAQSTSRLIPHVW